MAVLSVDGGSGPPSELNADRPAKTDICSHHKKQSFRVRSYIQNLKKLVDVELARKQRPAPTRGDLQADLVGWWSSLAEYQQARVFQISEIGAALVTDSGKKPAARLLAKELRKLGWREKRSWEKSGRNKRYWIPPCEISKNPFKNN